jgi:hypothetical protein
MVGHLEVLARLLFTGARRRDVFDAATVGRQRPGFSKWRGPGTHAA